MTPLPAGRSSMMVGDIRLTLVPDGYHRCDPLGTFLGSTQYDWDQHRDLLDDHGRVVMTMGALLAELPTGERALIDLGFGPRTVILEALGMEFWGGRLLTSLAELGLVPDDIDAVLYSHLHTDHVGWTTDARDDVLTFGRARHVMATAEWEWWRDKPGAGGPTEVDIDVLASRVELIDGEVNVLSGVSAVPTPGHTPGHYSFRISSGSNRAVVLGDAIHCPLQISHPEWAFFADTNPTAAQRAREQLIRELEEPDTTVVGAHFANAIFGRVIDGPDAKHVAFDVATPGLPQLLAPEAPSGAVVLPALR